MRSRAQLALCRTTFEPVGQRESLGIEGLAVDMGSEAQRMRVIAPQPKCRLGIERYPTGAVLFLDRTNSASESAGQVITGANEAGGRRRGTRGIG